MAAVCRSVRKPFVEAEDLGPAPGVGGAAGTLRRRGGRREIGQVLDRVLHGGEVTAAMPRVIQLLGPFELQFLGLIDHFKRVWAYDVELRKAARGKPFRMRNPASWEIILADRDIFVIDFASWITSLAGTPRGRRSFLDQLTNDDLTEFGVEEGPARDTDDPWLANHFWKSPVEAFGRLFPARLGSGKRWPEKADVRALKVELTAHTKGLEKQRDARAHVYDGKGIETVQNLGFEEIAGVFHRAVDVLHDVRLLVDRSNHHFPAVEEPKSSRTARDMVDMLLLGGIDNAVREWTATPQIEGARPREYLWQHREAYYDNLHSAHDERGTETPLFNDSPFQQYSR